MTTVAVERYLIKDACPHCGKPVYADEGYYSPTGAHAVCQAENTAALAKASRDLEPIFADLGIKPKRRVSPVGQGVVAIKLKAKVVKLVEDYYGLNVVESLIWGQRGSYRGPKWDLAAWGVDLVLENKVRVSISSWGTMTQSLKDAELRLMPDDRSANFFEC